VLWRRWLGDGKGIRPVKTEWLGADVVICLERGADLHTAQLMPLPLTVSCFSKIQIGFTCLVPAHLASPRKGPLNGCVCVSDFILVIVTIFCLISGSVLFMSDLTPLVVCIPTLSALLCDVLCTVICTHDQLNESYINVCSKTDRLLYTVRPDDCWFSFTFLYLSVFFSTLPFFTARCYASAVLSMALSPSVTSRSFSKTAIRRITQTTPHDTPGNLVFWSQRSPRNSTGVTPYGGAKCRWGGSKSATFDK